ncbi:MAG: thioredoxin [Planctomycetaceae bacterium]|nr:MAG: thioredoxin [Planctomycetaceae bacterium]
MSENTSDKPSPAQPENVPQSVPTTTGRTPKPIDRAVKIGFLIAVLVIGFFIWRGQKTEPTLGGWGTNLPLAMTQAKAGKAQVIVFFHHSPMSDDDTRMIKNSLDAEESRKAIAGKPYVKVSLDIEGNADIVKKYNIVSTPTVLLLDADGKEIRRLDKPGNHLDFYNKLLGLKTTE